MSAVTEKAARAKRLQGDEGFQEFMAEVKADQTSVFLDAHSTEDARSEAHAIIRALTKIEGTLTAAIGAQTFEQKKKGQHRGND